MSQVEQVQARPRPEQQDGEQLRRTQQAWRDDPSLAQRHPTLTAEWTGDDRSTVRLADKELLVNGPGRFGPMQLILAGLASCEIDVVATHAAIMGIEIDGITVELDAHFDARSYLGVDGPPPGYDRMAYTVRVSGPRITDGQRARLREALDRASPVADTIARTVKIDAALEVAR